MKNIYTVIIVNDDNTDLSTVSFRKFEDAVDYCIEEVGHDERYDSEDLRGIRKLLIDRMYCPCSNGTYYIEEAKLM